MQLGVLVIFFNDTATTEIYTLSLHDALPISPPRRRTPRPAWSPCAGRRGGCPGRSPRCSRTGPGTRSRGRWPRAWSCARSEEHTSELQSRQYLVCRLLLEKKKLTNYSRELIT